jgi:hypothetical protein
VTSCHSPFRPRRLDTPQAGPQLLAQSGGDDIPTAGQRTDHYVLRPVASVQHVTPHMAEPPRQSMALHGGSDRSRNDQSKLRITCRTPHIDHQVRLHSSLPVLDRGVEIGRPRHAVPRGKHRCPTGVGYQAVSERRPLPRRFDTMARPALVRIRRRKPCTRARRRLFGWKVRLPFATTLSLLHLASCSTRFPGPVGHACPHDASIGFVSRLVPGAASALDARIAAVSPTFGRLYEGTDRRSPGQTWPE